MRPRARVAGLLVRELPDEMLVYDLERHRAHCLNRGAGLVFRLCDGERTSSEIAAALPAEAGAEGEREALVGLALAQLEDACLLIPVAAPGPPAAAAAPAADGTRRELLRRAGAALLLPAIASVLAPLPAQAATACFEYIDCSFHLGEPCWCTSTSQCSTNTCIDVGGHGSPMNIHCHPCEDQ